MGNIKGKKILQKISWTLNSDFVYFQFFGQLSDKLHGVNLTVIDSEKCKKELMTYDYEVTDTQICTSTKFGAGTCIVSLTSDMYRKND